MYIYIKKIHMEYTSGYKTYYSRTKTGYIWIVNNWTDILYSSAWPTFLYVESGTFTNQISELSLNLNAI